MENIEQNKKHFFTEQKSHFEESFDGDIPLTWPPETLYEFKNDRRSGEERRSVLEEAVIPERRSSYDRRRRRNRRNDDHQHKRFAVKEGVYAALRTSSVKVGRALDISLSGLSFICISDTEILSRSCEFEIYVLNKSFHLRGLICQIIVDTELENNVPFSSIKMRRLSLRFKDLSRSQLSKLEYFIRHYTDHEPSISNEGLAPKELIEFIARKLVDYPDHVLVSEIEGSQTIVLELKVTKEDMGKIIGRRGRIASAIRTILRAATATLPKRFVLQLSE